MHASFMLNLNSRWSNTTVRLSNYCGTTRPRVILVLLSLSVFSLMGVDRGFAEKTRDELIAMCNADGADQEQKCVCRILPRSLYRGSPTTLCSYWSVAR